jgi:glycosyltransferase involved in cell wall biosynthesis
MGCGRLRLFSSNYALRYVKPWVSAALVRSFYEERFLRESYGYSADKVKLLRLPARNVVERQEFNAEDKEPFCFHCSLFTQDRKNVMRLMQAAVKYNFKLVIAGAPGTEAATQPYLDMAAAHPDNIQILGRISDEQLADCYRRAKVFALPSIMEGVGFVALEAAAFGCNIVITNIGGPKEYYDGMAHEVNPFSVDEIGRAVVAAMQEPTTDKLANHIAANYSLSANVRDLADIYATIPSMP